MRDIVVCSTLMLLMTACTGSQDTTPMAAESEGNQPAPYDTAAVDSFSAGAISVDVAAQIRMSSQAYQDSLKAVAEGLKKGAEAKKTADSLKKEKGKNPNNEEGKAKNSAKKTPETPAGTPT